jgi:hypothetical protein
LGWQIQREGYSPDRRVSQRVPSTRFSHTDWYKEWEGVSAANADNRDDDWGTIDHNLDKLKGSTKWEVTIDNFVGSNKLEIKLDYIEDDVDGTPWTSRIEKFKIGGTDPDKTKIELATSLEYNYHTLGLTSFFADKKTSSSPDANDGFYDFAGPNEDWVPEFSFKVAFDKNYFASNVGFALTAASFLSTIYPESIFHMSPNKLGGNKVHPHPVPTPTAALSGLVLFGGLLARRHRRNATTKKNAA